MLVQELYVVCVHVCIYSTYIVGQSIHTYIYTPSLKAVAPTVFMVGLQPLVPCYGLHLQWRRQWQTTPVQLNLPIKSSIGSPGV
jgi:hypothetical protein